MNMKPALLVIDVQKQFFNSNPQTVQSLRDAIEYINAAIALFRAKNLPVICIQHMDEKRISFRGWRGLNCRKD